jgi:hypothetical protein
MISHEWFRSSGGGDGVASHVALRALCRSGLPRPTNPDRCGTGSRSGQSRDGVGAGALCETERMSRKALPCNSRGNSAAMSRSGRNPLERRGIKRGRSRPCCGELRCRLIVSTSWKRTITFSDPRRSLIAPMTAQQSRTPKSFRTGKRSRFGITPALSLVSTPRTEGRTFGWAIAVAGAGLLRFALMRVLYPVRLQRQARQPSGPMDEFPDVAISGATRRRVGPVTELDRPETARPIPRPSLLALRVGEGLTPFGGVGH